MHGHSSYRGNRPTHPHTHTNTHTHTQTHTQPPTHKQDHYNTLRRSYSYSAQWNNSANSNIKSHFTHRFCDNISAAEMINISTAALFSGTSCREGRNMKWSDTLTQLSSLSCRVTAQGFSDSSAAIKLLIPCSVNRFRLITHQKATRLAEVIEKWSLNVLLRGLP